MHKLIDRKVYTDEIRGFIGKELVKVIIGVRRCGKSGILELIKQEVLKITDEGHIISVNFEDMAFFDLLDFKVLNKYILERMNDGEKYYIFLDEVQDVTGWERVVNSLRLKNTDIYVTGSNSKLLSGELATLLAGRYVSFDVGTLSFEEFIRFRKESGLTGGVENDRYGILEKYIQIGGFPLLSVTPFTDEDSQKIVKDLQASIVLKDIIARNNVKNVPLLEKVIAFIYDNVGRTTSVKKISDYLKSKGEGGDFDTISNYINYMEKACAIKRASRYDVKGKKLLESNGKYYLADHSLQYAIRDMKTTNKPGILENIVYNDLVRRGYKVYVGKMGDKEIDFVAERTDGGDRVYVQVCMEYGSMDTVNREFSPLKEINDHYPKYVVTTDTFWNEDMNGVRGIHLYDFLLREKL
jgi:predicted AAA+ superfamily ATPase